MVYLVGVILFVVGLSIGLDFQDIDQSIGFLNHRSILTHGWIVPVVLFWMIRKRPYTAFRLFTMGVCLGNAVHLSFDLFPQGWNGFSLIHIPILGRTGTVFSWLWIALSIVISIYLAVMLIRTMLELTVGVIGLLGTFALTAPGEKMFFGLPLLVLIIAGAIAMRFSSNTVMLLANFSKGRSNRRS